MDSIDDETSEPELVFGNMKFELLGEKKDDVFIDAVKQDGVKCKIMFKDGQISKIVY